jgi:hypothetical protein
MSERRYRHLPAVENRHLVGVVSRRDFLDEDIILVEDKLDHKQRF